MPLAFALLAGHPAAGVPAAIGALSVGFASRQGVYRTRAAAMLGTGAAMAFSAFVGCTTANVPALNIAAMGAWGVALGIVASLGTTANVVGINAALALAIFSQFRYGPQEAAITAALIFAGGALQTVLLVSIWPLQRFTAERTVLAQAYRALASYAVKLGARDLRPPDQRPFTTLSKTLADPQPFARRGEIAAFEVLLDEAERIRATLASLAIDRRVLAAHASTGDSGVLALGNATSTVLRAIAEALVAAKPPDGAQDAWASLDATLEELERQGDARSAGDARSLLGRLRSAWRAASGPADDAPSPGPGRPVSRLRATAFGEAFRTLRANCSLHSEYAQHAIRLGATLVLASLASHAFSLQRGYWVPLTVVLVLKPDFAATFGRGVSRIAGTLLGAVVASLVVAIFHPQAQAYIAFAVVFAGIGYAVFDTNYAIYTVTITAYVVFLLAFGGLPEHAALSERIEATLLGGAFALSAYGLWPTWERELVPVRLAEMLERQRAYLGLVLAAFVAPGERDETAMHAAQRASWLARTNAEASVDRFLSEPVRPRGVSVRAALGILAASRRAGLALLTLQSHIPDEPTFSSDALASLRAGLERCYDDLVAALRTGDEAPDSPPLRELQSALEHAFDERDGNEAANVISETDLLVESADTMADILRRLHKIS